MAPGLQISLSFGLTFGVPVLLAIRELYLLRRPPPPGWIWRPEDMRPPDPRPAPATSRVRPREREEMRELEDA